MGHSRRALIKGALCGVTVGALPRLGLAQSATLAVSRLRADVSLITGAGTNIVAAADNEGLVLVDGGLARNTPRLIEILAAQLGGRPVRTLFNTHWHPEQTGANLALAEAGAEIVAQVNTRLWLTTDIKRPWEDRVHAPLPPEARPKRTFYDSGAEVLLAGRPLAYGHLLQAHTDGDCYVFFPEANVLAAGGAVTSDRWPLVDWWTGGWLGGLVEGVETLLQIADEETLIVPAEGPVLGRAELAAQRDMYEELFVRFRDELLFKGLSPAEAVAARPTADYHPEWPNRDEFVTLAFQSLWGFFAPDV
jgi:glyoxylase-like metal-dependent hydrolase (beta-lactamase superfamily II)